MLAAGCATAACVEPDGVDGVDGLRAVLEQLACPRPLVDSLCDSVSAATSAELEPVTEPVVQHAAALACWLAERFDGVLLARIHAAATTTAAAARQPPQPDSAALVHAVLCVFGLQAASDQRPWLSSTSALVDVLTDLADMVALSVASDPSAASASVAKPLDALIASQLPALCSSAVDLPFSPAFASRLASAPSPQYDIAARHDELNAQMDSLAADIERLQPTHVETGPSSPNAVGRSDPARIDRVVRKLGRSMSQFNDWYDTDMAAKAVSCLPAVDADLATAMVGFAASLSNTSRALQLATDLHEQQSGIVAAVTPVCNGTSAGMRIQGQPLSVALEQTQLIAAAIHKYSPALSS
ncbi:hypothetical protein BC831DRAFT_483267 [Entophlyctis helioformis]|nr:hypothetical protein BC831DRAFT_483267 [Entophlyctis helioformis]